MLTPCLHRQIAQIAMRRGTSSLLVITNSIQHTLLISFVYESKWNPLSFDAQGFSFQHIRGGNGNVDLLKNILGLNSNFFSLSSILGITKATVWFSNFPLLTICCFIGFLKGSWFIISIVHVSVYLKNCIAIGCTVIQGFITSISSIVIL